MNQLQDINVAITLNPKTIDGNTPAAIRSLNQMIVQLNDELNRMRKLVNDHEWIIHGTEESNNT